MRSVENLLLPGNVLGDAALRAFAQACYADNKTFHQLRVLDLSDNFVTDAGVVELASVCGNTSSLRLLRTLRLSTNAIGTASLASIAAAVQASALTHLRVLELNNNGIGDEGLKVALAPAASPAGHVGLRDASLPMALT